MPVILVIDDRPETRSQVAGIIKENGYGMRSVSDPGKAETVIGTVKPDLVLMNQQPERFDSISLFMNLKETYPKLPVLLYALKSDTALYSLKHAIAMAFREVRPSVAKIVNLPEQARSRQIRIHNSG